jgi:hypothetical protein
LEGLLVINARRSDPFVDFVDINAGRGRGRVNLLICLRLEFVDVFFSILIEIFSLSLDLFLERLQLLFRIFKGVFGVDLGLLARRLFG